MVDVPPTPGSPGLLSQVVTVAKPASSCTTYRDGSDQAGKTNTLKGHLFFLRIPWRSSC